MHFNVMRTSICEVKMRMNALLINANTTALDGDFSCSRLPTVQERVFGFTGKWTVIPWSVECFSLLVSSDEVINAQLCNVATTAVDSFA